eukprot:7677863-Ditylum_brightwellii.AAC.2
MVAFHRNAQQSYNSIIDGKSPPSFNLERPKLHQKIKNLFLPLKSQFNRTLAFIQSINTHGLLGKAAEDNSDSAFTRWQMYLLR